jgi:hypothetical protein
MYMYTMYIYQYIFTTSYFWQSNIMSHNTYNSEICLNLTFLGPVYVFGSYRLN